MNQVRMGIVGIGNMGSAHAQVLFKNGIPPYAFRRSETYGTHLTKQSGASGKKDNKPS